MNQDKYLEISNIIDISSDVLRMHHTFRNIFDDMLLGRRGPADYAASIVDNITDILEKYFQIESLDVARFGDKQLITCSKKIATELIDRFFTQKHEHSLDWLEKITNLQKADLNIIIEIVDTKIRDKINMSNGILFVPISFLPESLTLKTYKYRIASKGLHEHERLEQQAFAVLQIKGVERSGDIKLDYFKDHVDVISKTVNALNVSKNDHFVIGEIWVDFADPDLCSLESGRLYKLPNYETTIGFPRDVYIESNHIYWVEKYLQSSDTVKNRISIAISRITYARRRIELADKAIDLAICLESLFSDDKGKTEIGHKLRTRIAWFLGDTLIEQKRISDSIKKLYNLRSAAVHGSVRPSKDSENREAMDAGLDIAAQAIQKIILENKIPNLNDLELAAGNKWIR